MRIKPTMSMHKDIESLNADLVEWYKEYSAQLRQVVEQVAHIGVDFGYGEFQLDEGHIETARELLEI